MELEFLLELMVSRGDEEDGKTPLRSIVLAVSRFLEGWLGDMGCPFEIGTCHRETERYCPTRDQTGETLCTLGWTSMPARRGEAIVEYKVTHTSGDVIGVRLGYTHRKMIRLMSERGGETPWEWSRVDEGMREALKKHLGDLIEMGAMTEVKLVGTERVMFRLTDMGKHLATQIIKEGAAPKIKQVRG